MIKTDEQHILGAYSAMNHVCRYIDGARKQTERFCEDTHCNKHMLEYVINSYKYMQDWLESGISELKTFTKDDKE